MGTYLLFIIIDQVILATPQTVVWKYIFYNPDKLDGNLLVSSLYYRVVVIKAPLQGLCYTVRDAVDW